MAAPSGAALPPGDAHAGGLAGAVLRAPAAFFPYIVNEEGIPLRARFQLAFQKQYRQRSGFSTVIYRARGGGAGPSSGRGSRPSLPRDRDPRGSPSRNTLRLGQIVPVRAGLPARASVPDVYTGFREAHLRIKQQPRRQRHSGFGGLVLEICL